MIHFQTWNCALGPQYRRNRNLWYLQQCQPKVSSMCSSNIKLYSFQAAGSSQIDEMTAPLDHWKRNNLFCKPLWFFVPISCESTLISEKIQKPSDFARRLFTTKIKSTRVAIFTSSAATSDINYSVINKCIESNPVFPRKKVKTCTHTTREVYEKF